MTKALTLAHLAKMAQVEVEANAHLSGFSVDSRTLKTGEVYFALPGQRVDGHSFLPEIVAKGAAAAVVSFSYRGEAHGLPLIRVPDVLVFLQNIAKKRLEEIRPRTVAITGSVGKTTTKDFLGTLLKQKYCIAVTPGNNNSQVGIPLVILNHLKGKEEVVVFEMGMTLPGHIERLTQIAPPDISIITNVALVHACNFDQGDEAHALSQIARVKGEIFSSSRTKVGLVNHEVASLVALEDMGSCRKLAFSTQHPEADFFLQTGPNGMKLKSPDSVIDLPFLTLPGKHNQLNFLAAAAAARYFDLDWKEIVEGMKHLTLPERRLQSIEKNGITFINDSYNACTISLKSALESLPEPHLEGRKIAVIGEMLELGKFSAKCHLEVGEFALSSGIDKIFCLGQGCEPIWQLWKESNKPVEWTLNRNDLVEALRQQLLPGDIVLLKGSRGNGLWKVLEEI